MVDDAFRLNGLARYWPILAFAASGAMLAAAHAFEYFGQDAPCRLCLRQRDVYWASLAMAGTGWILFLAKPGTRFLTALNTMLALVFLTEAVVAGFHAGVEWDFWPGPAGCSALGDGDSIRNMTLGGLNNPIAIGDCGEAPWRILGLSMAGWNMLAALGLSIVSFAAARRVASAGDELQSRPGGAKA
ncbi:MAG: disulfide bond formation protein B [Pseudomonadota bacterium]